MSRQLRAIILTTIIFLLTLSGIGVVSITAVADNTASFVPAAESKYTTCFGGTGTEDATKIAFNNEGNTILIGQTGSADFPVTTGAIQKVISAALLPVVLQIVFTLPSIS